MATPESIPTYTQRVADYLTDPCYRSTTIADLCRALWVSLWDRQWYIDAIDHPRCYFVAIDEEGVIEVTTIGSNNDPETIARGVTAVAELIARVPSSRVVVSSTVHFASEYTNDIETIALARSL